MSEWTGKLSRIDAIRIIERATDKEDPAWLWSVEDWYDEDTDTLPSIYHVMAALDVTESEYREATGAQNLNWPDESDSELTTLVRQLAEREKTEQDLWEKLNCQDNEIDDLKRQLAEAQRWKLAVDNELVCCHLGTTDSMEPSVAIASIGRWHYDLGVSGVCEPDSTAGKPE